MRKKLFIKCFMFVCLEALSINNKFLTATETTYSHLDCHRVPLDEKLIKLMDFPNGVFIEVGANDGVTQSNTKRFEEFHGWTGILVEPSEVLFSRLCTNRPRSKCFRCALGNISQNNTYVWGDFNGNLMSSVEGKRLGSSSNLKVPIRSLQSILEEVGIKHVHFFSLDTEGYELNILRGIDFEKTVFDYLLIEIYPLEYNEIVAFLSEQGYSMVENFSNYNLNDNPQWDGTHNDYLFKRVGL